MIMHAYLNRNWTKCIPKITHCFYYAWIQYVGASFGASAITVSAFSIDVHLGFWIWAKNLYKKLQQITAGRFLRKTFWRMMYEKPFLHEDFVLGNCIIMKQSARQNASLRLSRKCILHTHKHAIINILCFIIHAGLSALDLYRVYNFLLSKSQILLSSAFMQETHACIKRGRKQNFT